MTEFELNEREFRLFQEYIYQEVGISLSDKKVALVRGRLSKRLRQLGMEDFQTYYRYLTEDQTGQEIFFLINAISTNVTSFFRESAQWDYLEENLEHILGNAKGKKLRIWSAGCSTGEEPYSIAIFLKDYIKDFGQWDIKILATDISQNALSKAQKGIYTDKDLAAMPRHMIHNNFTVIKTASGEQKYQIHDRLRDLVLFRMFNLVYGNYSVFKNRFDLIFCRNVMIYFDPQTQQTLVSHFGKLLEKNSLLLVGHSESLTRNKEEFKLIRSSIYQRL